VWHCDMLCLMSNGGGEYSDENFVRLIILVLIKILK
jgi:hypothetical protein